MTHRDARRKLGSRSVRRGSQKWKRMRSGGMRAPRGAKNATRVWELVKAAARVEAANEQHRREAEAALRAEGRA